MEGWNVQMQASLREGDEIAVGPEWDALWERLSAAADELGSDTNEMAGDVSMWDVPWSATELGA
ncbi:hypothetical protein OG689_41485 [Kitasatospora sp. NBC_00240]|uniref:hypothetical protein n=1 Tax=Kitasatospora sp. NBC_00240 TaxID=2903567 RepID=UPI00224E5FFF|nr:hypothetical protein [Kitasatospora sp. NBC_00240]MCX5215630.1 hypothetical protein [Kitasatospora sp. NBC_00240]